MTLEDSIHSQRLRVLRDAERLGNVSEACRRHGLSRTLFYRLRRRLELYGPDGVHPKRGQARRGRPPAVPVQTERRVIALALAWPTCGPQWYQRPARARGRGDRRDDGLAAAAPAAARHPPRALAVLERASAATTGLLTERTAKPVRHVAADAAGRAAVARYVLCGQAEGRGQGVADHRL